MKTLALPEGDALVVVAHPDDETIWMGGTMLRFRHIRWTVVSLCRKNDPDRAPKFRRVSRIYGARAFISNLEDEGVLGIKESVPEIERRLRTTLHSTRFTYLFTHGYNGEYGHPRHKGVHQAIRGLVAKKKLRPRNLLYFAYEVGSGMRMRNVSRATARVVLTLKEQAQKRSLIKDLYGFSPQSFENRSCLPIETFTEYDIKKRVRAR